MGMDFIRAASGKPYAKRWAKGLERANTPGLFDIQFEAAAKVVTASLAADTGLQSGTQVSCSVRGATSLYSKGSNL